MNRNPSGHERCQDLLERLSRYIDGELSPADRSSVEQHLRDCPCCEKILHGLEHTVDLCREQGRPELPPDVRARALQRVQQLMAGPASGRSHKSVKP
jgi:anti-sigma factor RsiW